MASLTIKPKLISLCRQSLIYGKGLNVKKNLCDCNVRYHTTTTTTTNTNTSTSSTNLNSLHNTTEKTNLQNSQMCRRSFGSTALSYSKNWYSVTYEKADGEKITVKGKEGDNLLDIAINNNVDLDGFGACEGTLSCSTCHLIFSKENFDKLSDPPADEELDMLDLAFGVTDTSRLGCQVCLTKNLDGVVVRVPEGTADARTK